MHTTARDTFEVQRLSARRSSDLPKKTHQTSFIIVLHLVDYISRNCNYFFGQSIHIYKDNALEHYSAHSCHTCIEDWLRLSFLV